MTVLLSFPDELQNAFDLRNSHKAFETSSFNCNTIYAQCFSSWPIGDKETKKTTLGGWKHSWDNKHSVGAIVERTRIKLGRKEHTEQQCVFCCCKKWERSKHEAMYTRTGEWTPNHFAPSHNEMQWQLIICKRSVSCKSLQRLDCWAYCKCIDEPLLWGGRLALPGLWVIVTLSWGWAPAHASTLQSAQVHGTVF